MPIINMTLTKSGYNAQFGRQPSMHLRFSRMALTSFAGHYVPSVNQSTFQGPEVWSTTKIRRQLNNRLDMVFKFVVPDSAPGTPSAPVAFHEVGLFVQDNRGQEHLFAVGLFNPPYVKDKDFQLLVTCYLRSPAATGFSVEFEANELADLPTVTDYSNLPSANISGPNLLLVRNGRPTFSGGPALVCKVSNGDEWGIVNGSVLYTGYSGEQTNPLVFNLPDLRWEKATGSRADLLQAQTSTYFGDRDLCMITVTDGPGRYQTRLLRNDLSTNFPLGTLLQKTSKVKIWAGPGCC
jgi:hypothetical protein